METEVPKVPAKKKEPSKRAAAAQKKKPLATVLEISDDDYNDINEIDDDDDDNDDDNDEDSEIEVVATPEARKKGGGKLAANAKAVKAPAAAKKRGAANKQQPQTLAQKLFTDMLKPAENSRISPEKKVRKMRASPFNKKSGSVLGRVGKVNEVTENEENSGFASTSASTEETIEVAPARARPQRVNQVRKQERVGQNMIRVLWLQPACTWHQKQKKAQCRPGFLYFTLKNYMLMKSMTQLTWCYGPGSCPSKRVAWARELIDEEAEQFLMPRFIDPDSQRPWLAQRMALRIPYSA